MVARFTLDSATEFLFGSDVKSLSAPLPYPPTSTAAQEALKLPVHPADEFAQAFLAAQQASGKRSRFLGVWPLVEFWQDRVQTSMAVVDRFIEPLVRDALRNKGKKTPVSDQKIPDEETLLGHLVQVTDGQSISVSFKTYEVERA